MADENRQNHLLTYEGLADYDKLIKEYIPVAPGDGEDSIIMGGNNGNVVTGDRSVAFGRYNRIGGNDSIAFGKNLTDIIAEITCDLPTEKGYVTGADNSFPLENGNWIDFEIIPYGQKFYVEINGIIFDNEYQFDKFEGSALYITGFLGHDVAEAINDESAEAITFVFCTDNQVVLGKYNEPKSDTLFSIGNGTNYIDRKNVFEIGETTNGACLSYKNGLLNLDANHGENKNAGIEIPHNGYIQEGNIQLKFVQGTNANWLTVRPNSLSPNGTQDYNIKLGNENYPFSNIYSANFNGTTFSGTDFKGINVYLGKAGEQNSRGDILCDWLSLKNYANTITYITVNNNDGIVVNKDVTMKEGFHVSGNTSSTIDGSLTVQNLYTGNSGIKSVNGNVTLNNLSIPSGKTVQIESQIDAVGGIKIPVSSSGVSVPGTVYGLYLLCFSVGGVRYRMPFFWEGLETQLPCIGRNVGDAQPAYVTSSGSVIYGYLNEGKQLFNNASEVKWFLLIQQR